MKITYIHHSGFLVETDRSRYLFDYEKGPLPRLWDGKPLFVLSSHSHADHYNPEIFPLLTAAGVTEVRAILSHDITPPEGTDALSVAPEREYSLGPGQTLTTFRSTDLGVAFLIEDGPLLIYHAGDLNDWVWDDEPDAVNRRMTEDYRRQMALLSRKLGCREIDAAFVVLDPRQEQDCARGLCHFLETVPVKQVFPMHYWGNPGIIGSFLNSHPEYRSKIRQTEEYKQR